MTDFELMETIAKVLAEDKKLEAYCTEKFSQKLTVFLEYDPRKWPTEKNAPFCYLNIDGSLNDLAQPSLESQIGCIFGICRKGEETTSYGSKLTGFEMLSKDILPLAEHGLRKIPQVFLEKTERDFVFENYPLVMASLTLTFKQNAPIGARR